MYGKGNQALVLEMDFPHKVIDQRLRGPIRYQRQRDALHRADTATQRADDDEFRPRGVLQKRMHGLEEDEGPDGVDGDVFLHFGDGDRGDGFVGFDDAGVGDDDVDFGDVVG